jgi:hypothetical protein
LLLVFERSKYNGLLRSAAGFFMVVLITAYGDDTGPITSKTLPTTFKLSSTTSHPNFGGLSVLMIRLLDGVTLNTLPIFCKPVPLSKNINFNVNAHLSLSIIYLIGGEIQGLFSRKLHK